MDDRNESCVKTSETMWHDKRQSKEDKEDSDEYIEAPIGKVCTKIVSRL